MQLVGELPLSALGGLLSYAEEQEIETSTRPLWIAHYMLSKIKGEEFIDYDVFLASVLGKEKETKPEREKKQSSPEEITARFENIIAADREKNRKEG